MRGEPRDLRALDEARLQAGHFPVRVDPRSRSPGRSACPRRDGHFLALPDAVVPLADESAPVLDGRIDGLLAHAECGFLVAIRGGCQHVHAVELSRWKRDRLALA